MTELEALLIKALVECEETLALCEREALVDPQHGEEVEALGRRIGFGALMASASASWAKVNRENGYPAGGQFVAGPCHSTVLRALKLARAALARPATIPEGPDA